jgi:signal transduction histidine kinase
LVVVCALIVATRFVASPTWAAANQSFPTTLWATNAVVSAAILGGPVIGAAFGLTVRVASAVAKGGYDLNVGRDATVVVLLAVGVGVGLASMTARRNHVRIQQAMRLAAAADERARLSRQVHDGVLQVLALISRRGAEIGGETAQLAELAGQQERSLRRLIADIEPSMVSGEHAEIDLRMLLRPHAGDLVTVSEPADPVLLDHRLAVELEAAVVNALDNARLHAGPGVRAFVLVEDLGDQVVVSIRDDGRGIADGRLSQAVAEGRMGVSQSIVARLEALGGTARLDTAPDEGTEWELTVSKRTAEGSRRTAAAEGDADQERKGTTRA